jgi:hypothetical protein
MQINLSADEAALLLQILRNYVSNLRFEISNTDEQPIRENLKESERLARAVISRLEVFEQGTS